MAFPPLGPPASPPASAFSGHCEQRRVTNGGARGRGCPSWCGVPDAGGFPQEWVARAANAGPVVGVGVPR